MMIEDCGFKNPIKSFFYDGTPKSAKFVEENFREFEYIMWTIDKVKSKRLIYRCSDGEYDNVVQPNVHIVQFGFSGHITHTDWFTPEEFERYFIVNKH